MFPKIEYFLLQKNLDRDISKQRTFSFAEKQQKTNTFFCQEILIIRKLHTWKWCHLFGRDWFCDTESSRISNILLCSCCQRRDSMPSNAYTGIYITEPYFFQKSHVPYNLNRINCKKNPTRVEVDCSWAIIHSVINVFCEQNINLCREIVQNETCPKFTIIHICAAHTCV